MIKEKKLSMKQRIFAEEYIKNGMNGTKAAIDAGYSERYAKSTAYKLLHNNELVMDFIKKRSKEIIKEKEIVADELYDCVAKVIRGEYMNKKIVKCGRELREIEVKPSASEYLQACNLYAKLKGFIDNDNKEDDPVVNIIWDIGDDNGKKIF